MLLSNFLAATLYNGELLIIDIVYVPKQESEQLMTKQYLIKN